MLFFLTLLLWPRISQKLKHIKSQLMCQIQAPWDTFYEGKLDWCCKQSFYSSYICLKRGIFENSSAYDLAINGRFAVLCDANLLSSCAGCRQDNLDHFVELLLKKIVGITKPFWCSIFNFDRIRRAVGLVTPQMLENVWGNMTRRLKKTV